MSGSLESLRELNRLRIVDALRHDGTASRAEIARQTGLSPSTVSTVITELQRAGLVVESTLAPAGRQGRPAAQLALDPSAGAAVGIDFDHDKIRVAVSDLARKKPDGRRRKRDHPLVPKGDEHGRREDLQRLEHRRSASDVALVR